VNLSEDGDALRSKEKKPLQRLGGMRACFCGPL